MPHKNVFGNNNIKRKPFPERISTATYSYGSLSALASEHENNPSSGTVWKSRWTSWAPVPNKPTVSVDVKQHFNQISSLGPLMTKNADMLFRTQSFGKLQHLAHRQRQPTKWSKQRHFSVQFWDKKGHVLYQMQSFSFPAGPLFHVFSLLQVV